MSKRGKLGIVLWIAPIVLAHCIGLSQFSPFQYFVASVALTSVAILGSVLAFPDAMKSVDACR